MLIVSNYHYVRPDFTALFPSIFGVTPTEFEQQLKLLQNVSEFIHPRDLLAHSDAVLSSKDRYSLITFDDGLREQFDFALPVLDAQQIPAVFFVNSLNFETEKVTTVHKIHLLRSVMSSSAILAAIAAFPELKLTESEVLHAQKIYRYDDPTSAAVKYLLNFRMSFLEQEKFVDPFFQEHFNESEVHDLLYMNKNQLQHLAHQGFLGSHTHHHYPIGMLSEADMEFELKHAKEYLENITQSVVELVSYPYGTAEACTPVTADLARKVGYKLGFTTHRGTNTTQQDLLLLHRYDCNDMPGGKSYDPQIFQ